MCSKVQSESAGYSPYQKLCSTCIVVDISHPFQYLDLNPIVNLHGSPILKKPISKIECSSRHVPADACCKYSRVYFLPAFGLFGAEQCACFYKQGLF
jgi:hypothetical protein